MERRRFESGDQTPGGALQNPLVSAFAGRQRGAGAAGDHGSSRDYPRFRGVHPSRVHAEQQDFCWFRILSFLFNLGGNEWRYHRHSTNLIYDRVDFKQAG